MLVYDFMEDLILVTRTWKIWQLLPAALRRIKL